MNPIALSSRRREEEEKEKVDIRVFWSTDVVSIRVRGSLLWATPAERSLPLRQKLKTVLGEKKKFLSPPGCVCLVCPCDRWGSHTSLKVTCWTAGMTRENSWGVPSAAPWLRALALAHCCLFCSFIPSSLSFHNRPRRRVKMRTTSLSAWPGLPTPASKSRSSLCSP